MTTNALPLPQIIETRHNDRNRIAKALRAGAIERVRRGAYVEVPQPEAQRRPAPRRDEAAALAQIVAVHRRTRADHFVSHVSAAVLWGWRVWDLPDLTHLYQRYRASGHAASDVVHHRNLPADQHAEHQGIPVTSKVRTAVDCALTMRPVEALVIVDSALADGVAREDLLDDLEARPDRRGTRAARRVIEIADPGAESHWESWVRYVLVRAGLPTPATQVVVPTRLGSYRCDMGWPEWRVVVEFDGLVKYRDAVLAPDHSGAQELMREKRRGDAIIETGVRLVRVTKHDRHDPDDIANRVLPLLPPDVRRGARPDPLLPPAW
ncbi:hypothetical protein [Myceligenerans indicum]|uniref:DUF559 domain-containing protein n=1 Tax=Myceligenerans indicum TaxID=2593663 RepID=A0ABS1LEV7_9MICO|nr:hypothetical protein [Myceligenerans indicum]MBL0884797.1 hypothetical protein [Myceligenerans indicum]